MKRKTLILIIITLITAQGYTQTKPFRFGVKVAPNISWLSPDSKGYESDGASMGFSWGFTADITLADNYFVRTGFNMDYLKGRLSYPYLSNDPLAPVGRLSRKYNLRYLDFPLVMKLRTNQFDKMAYFGEVGFSAALNIKSTANDEFIYGVTNVPSEADIQDDINFFKGSLVVGAGLEYFIDNSTSLFVSLNFVNGLTNILNGENNVDPNVKEKAQLYTFQLNIGVLF